MYEQRADRPAEHDRPSGSPTLVDAASLPRSGMVPSWITRISWGSVFAATFVVVALQFALTALSIWGNFGFGNLTLDRFGHRFGDQHRRLDGHLGRRRAALRRHRRGGALQLAVHR